MFSKSFQFSPLSLRCTGLGLAGPLSNSKISISIPGKALSALDSSAIILFPSKSEFPRLFSQGIVSNWICPIVSLGALAPAVFWFNPPAPAKEKTLSTPGCALTINSAWRTSISFSVKERFPLALTYTIACSGSPSTKNSTP